MIGYSDSSKDAGKLAASWAQYCTQEKLQSISNKYKVKINFISWSRWICRSRRRALFMKLYYLSLQAQLMVRTKVTEQGEVIQQKFGTESLAEYTLGTYIGFSFGSYFVTSGETKRIIGARLMNDMSKVASNAYRQSI